MAALGAGWFFLAPPALGGDTGYVVTNGVSMQPRIHTGDLALVRPASAYHVGDIAAYHSRTLHVTVLHRIVAVTPHWYIFKGDNNSWRDPEHVTRAQIIGKLWVLAPTLGMRMAQVRSPVVIATLAGIAVVLLFGGAGVHRSRRRRRRGPEPKWRVKQPKWLPEQPATQSGAIGSSGAVAVAALALAACLGVSVLAWTAPARRTVPEHVGYRQSGAFAYAATTIPGAVYRTGHATTGQPIFARLAGPVQAQFAYALDAPAVRGLSGTAAMDIVLASQNGWARTVPLEAPTAFTGTHVALAGIVHLRRLERLLERVAAATAQPGASFTLTLVPDVHVHGTIAGHPFTAAYSPQLPFTLTPYELAPVLPGAPQGTRAAPGAARARVPSRRERVGRRGDDGRPEHRPPPPAGAGHRRPHRRACSACSSRSRRSPTRCASTGAPAGPTSRRASPLATASRSSPSSTRAWAPTATSSR